MWRKWLSLGLVFGLSFAPLSALPSPPSQSSPQSGSVTLSADEYAAVEAAISQAKEALRKSNEQIATQSKTLTVLWIFSGTLALALTLEAVADLTTAIKR